MKYIVTGTYITTQEVDTESNYFKRHFEREKRYNPKISEDDFVILFAERCFDDHIFGDDGNSSMSAGFLDWTKEKLSPD